ncbi:MAG: helix-turn-helix transcriptional regulator, partial [bacterium]|nr:helix-turn-helix transcriptional regulator [bacterium]
MNTKQLLGKRIKELIKKKGLRQDELAEKIGIEPTALSNIVTG